MARRKTQFVGIKAPQKLVALADKLIALSQLTPGHPVQDRTDFFIKAAVLFAQHLTEQFSQDTRLEPLLRQIQEELPLDELTGDGNA